VRLVSVILGFVLGKLGKFLAILAGLFLVLLLVSAAVPALQSAEAERDRLREVSRDRAALEADVERLLDATEESFVAEVASLAEEAAEEADQARQRVADASDEAERALDERDEACGTIDKVVAWLLPGDACKAAEAALEKAEELKDKADSGLAQTEERIAILSDPELSADEKLDRIGEDDLTSEAARELDVTQAELAQKQAEERSLEEAQGTWAGRIVNLWALSWKWLALLAALAVVMPALVRVVSYFVLMPLLSRSQRRIRLADGSDETGATLVTGLAERTLTVELGPGEVLSARSEHVRPVDGKRARSRLLYDLSAPFVSFAAGLDGLSRVSGGGDGTVAVLATPDDPDSYLMRIDFTDHPGLVMRPRHVVGVIGSPDLRTRWRWGILALATWQVRYILFAGTGSLIVQGGGDVRADSPRGESRRMEQHLVMGFDSRLVAGVNRTESFWPYLLGRTPLVDDEFSGGHPFFWQKASTQGPGSPITRTFGAFFSAVGKLLGF